MEQKILWELHFLLAACGVGVLFGGGYDLLNFIRLLIRHCDAVTVIEDFCYWTAVGIAIFGLMYRENSGVIRGFALIGVAAGLLAYYRGPGTLTGILFHKMKKIQKKRHIRKVERRKQRKNLPKNGKVPPIPLKSWSSKMPAFTLGIST